MGKLHRILVVEADEAECVRLATVLGEDYDVVPVDSGRGALGLLERREFDLVLLGGVGCGKESEELFLDLARRSPRPKVILMAPAFCSEVLERAAILDADGVLESRDEGEVAASVAAHLGI